MLNIDDAVEWTHNEKRMLKYMLENDGMQFMRYFFKFREGSNMLLNWHHYVIEYVLQAVIDMKIPRLIINVAPGYTKTEQCVLNFIARGLAINETSKFIHASFSKPLVLENSSKIKDTIKTPQFQELWPMTPRTDKDSKEIWYTESGGGMLAAPAGGTITGFRAGRMIRGEFNGAVVIDDPLKPSDAGSPTKRAFINSRFNNTIRSRLALEETPIIVIMQRVDDDDLSGFLLRGGSEDTWHHLSLPCNISYGDMKPYNKEYTHGVPININELLWCMKFGADYAF